jgi:YD repeat-containing protein
MFENDAFNRRISVVDPDGVETETEYDVLDRVRFVRQTGAMPADDLTTW